MIKMGRYWLTENRAAGNLSRTLLPEQIVKRYFLRTKQLLLISPQSHPGLRVMNIMKLAQV